MAVKSSKSKESSKVKAASNGKADHGAETTHLAVQKTYKLYIGGQFPRTESGRYYTLKGKGDKHIANVCLGTRKDFRNAVVAARKAFGGWAGRSAYNRAQILYRIAEMLESRKALFIEELESMGATKAAATKEVVASIDRITHYAGWADKYQQIFSAVNPVASSHFDFSIPEPQGVVAIAAPEENGLLGLVSTVIPAICGGNSCVVLASEQFPICSISFAEVLNSSDVPGGVVNILTGKIDELEFHFATHKDVNAYIYCNVDDERRKEIDTNCASNLKRPIHIKQKNWYADDAQSPYLIMNCQEIKTTWHPIGI